MWWNKVIFGCNAYQVVLWFLAYSILGWLVESIYMSICNRKITNRGFGMGPICPIYGVGALTVYFLLRSYVDKPLRLFLYGMILATTLEFITAVIMHKIFGEVWWDYREKPFNYKGILCLESSIAWGFYTLGLFFFLQDAVSQFVDALPSMVGKIGGTITLAVLTVDYMAVLYKRRKGDAEEKVDSIEVFEENYEEVFGEEAFIEEKVEK